ncbi:MAG TPA: hypothetical protein VG164_00630 [Trebonia sp.]|jgi:hypothetical protein|nr:hypothetical protein [Trebonia sp.]
MLAAGVISAAVAALLAWFVRNRELEPEDVTLGFLGPSLAAIYLLVLALALATEWQTIGSAQSAVGNEATAIRQLYWSASGLPAAEAGSLRAQVRDYTTTVLTRDWPEMERGTLDERSEQQLTMMGTYVLRLNAQTSAASNAQQYALSQISTLATSRAGREGAAGTRLPLGVIIAVIATSLIVCLFPFAGGLRSAPMSVTIAILQVALVTIGVVVVFQLDNPFTGPLATGPGPVAAVAAQIGAQ